MIIMTTTLLGTNIIPKPVLELSSEFFGRIPYAGHCAQGELLVASAVNIFYLK